MYLPVCYVIYKMFYVYMMKIWKIYGDTFFLLNIDMDGGTFFLLCLGLWFLKDCKMYLSLFPFYNSW